MSRITYFFLGVILVWGTIGLFAARAVPSDALGANALQNLWDRLRVAPPPGASPPGPIAAPYAPAVDYEAAVVRAVEHAAPAVVSVIVTKDLPIIERCPLDPFADLPPQLREFFGPFEFDQPCEKGTRKQQVGGGSGFIVSEDGLVLTNRHVVADADAAYTVLTNEGKKYAARVVARDPAQDLAVVQILSPGQKLPTLTLGDSDSVKLGQTAIAIGNALGEFRNTVSVGIISGLARTVTASGGGEEETLEGVIQTDAAINPGNSGGPLLNLRGEVVGVNTAIAAGAENIGFSIPVNRAKRDLESVRRTGKISVPYLGVRYILITEELAERDELPVSAGALVRGSDEGPGVLPDSPAAAAGIASEDIIVEIGSEAVSVERSLASLIQKRQVGDRVAVRILRAGKPLTVTVVLGERPTE